jgi:hypothetical protein
MGASNSKDVQIRERAYQLWEAAGCPQDKDQEYWFRAERELQRMAPTAGNAEHPQKRAKPASSHTSGIRVSST